MRVLPPQRVIVTGGASGIGEAVVRAFAAQGADVGVITRSSDSMERSLKNGLADHVDRVRWRIADVADEAAVVTAVDELSSELGGVQAVVASAGVVGEFGASVGEVTSSDFRHVLDVNVLGVFHLVKAALPHLVRHTDSSVTIVGSDSGFVSVPWPCDMIVLLGWMRSGLARARRGSGRAAPPSGRVESCAPAGRRRRAAPGRRDDW